RSDFFEVQTDLWLSLYWLLLCGTLIYLLGYGTRALLVLRKDKRSRFIATLVHRRLHVGHAGVRRADRHRDRQALVGGTFVWIFACTCGAGFALAAAHAWRTKTKWFSRSDR